MNGDGSGFSDVVEETVGDEAMMTINTPFFRSEFDKQESTGIRTLGWANSVVLVAGMDADDGVATIGQKLSPDQAREVADGLYEAAEQAEEEQQAAEDYDPEPDGILERLMP